MKEPNGQVLGLKGAGRRSKEAWWHPLTQLHSLPGTRSPFLELDWFHIHPQAADP